MAHGEQRPSVFRRPCSWASVSKACPIGRLLARAVKVQNRVPEKQVPRVPPMPG